MPSVVVPGENIPQTPFVTNLTTVYHGFTANLQDGMCFILSCKWLDLILQHGTAITSTLQNNLYTIPVNSQAAIDLTMHQIAYATRVADPLMPAPPAGMAYPTNQDKSQIMGYYLVAVSGGFLHRGGAISDRVVTNAAERATLSTDVDTILNMGNTQAVLIAFEYGTHGHCAAIRKVGAVYYLYDPAGGVYSSGVCSDHITFLTNHHHPVPPVPGTVYTFTVTQVI